jgi:excinuclease ABC subunit B
MAKFKIYSSYKPTGDQPQAIKALVEGFKELNHQTLLGVTGSGKTFTMANIISQLGKKTLILAHNKTLAAQLYAEFKEFFPNNKVEYFVSYYDYYQPEAYVPSSDTYIEKDSSINDEIDKLRHSTTQSLLSHDDVIVISSVSCIYGLGDPDEYLAQKITCFKKQKIKRDEFLRQLVNIQYARNDIDFSRGTFRVRGDIVEIFPASEDSKVFRIEFFDEEIENISLQDPLTGKSLIKLDKIEIFPSSHYVVGKEKLKTALESIRKELQIRLTQLKNENKLVEYQRLEQKTMLDLEMLEETGFCTGIENYSRHFTGLKAGEPPPTLVDFFKKDFLLIIDESHMTVSQVGAMYRGDQSRKNTLIEYGFRLPSAADNRPLKFTEFEERLDKVLYVSATPGEYELNKSQKIAEQVIRPTGLVDPQVYIRPAKNQISDLLVTAQEEINKGFRVLVTTLTKKSAEDLTEYFQKQKLKVKYLHSDIETLERVEILNSLRKGDFDILIGINLLREGLDLPEVSLVAVLDADKEGFLRSEKSLIQTIGRAARNSKGFVILYADKSTLSMQKAISETNRRRRIQEDYNKEHNIIPQTIIKGIKLGIAELLKEEKDNLKIKSLPSNLSQKQIETKIKNLEKDMKSLVKKLKFEEAAEVRDQISHLKKLWRLSGGEGEKE